MTLNDLTIVVCCNKTDLFLARICISSIRYFYPNIAIELVKDLGNGFFNTGDIEKYFDVCVVDLGIPKLGWSGAKFHYLYQKPSGKKVLLLDADIVFIGPFLERMLPIISMNDYVVSSEETAFPNAEWVKSIYFDIDAVKEAYPSYNYPGYFFNAGQIFLTLGSIEASRFEEFFDPRQFPFWKKSKLFPLVDQSVYNYLLPTLEQEKVIKLGTDKFFVWAESDEFLNLPLQDVMDKKIERGLAHWAGCFRSPYVNKMERGDILTFFEKHFYSHIKMGAFLYALHFIIPACEYYLKLAYHKLKPMQWLRG